MKDATTLSYELISLSNIVGARHKHSGDYPGLIVHVTPGEDLRCRVVGDMCMSYRPRVDHDDIEHARAVIGPGLLLTTDIDACCDLSGPPIYGIPSAISEHRLNISPPPEISDPPLKYLIPP